MSMILPFLLAAAAVTAPPCTTGTWITKAGGQAIFKLEIGVSSNKVAIWSRPRHFESDGYAFSDVDSNVVRRASTEAHIEDGDLVLSFDDPRPNATPDVFRIRCAKAGHIAVTYVGPGFEPFDFVKASSGEAALGPWDSATVYKREIVRPTNAEMTQIFNNDQAARQSGKIDWTVVGPADDRRRRRTQELLDSGALQSGDDFYHAAFVFQHGSTANDYLKAHLLAMIAAERGRSGATWIASATLDRYLQAIGKPQVLGTQFRLPKDGPATQEPYDRNLVSDAMRAALHVPPLAEQEKQRQEYTDRETKSRIP